MKLTTVILIMAIIQVSASTYAQKISLFKKNVPLAEVLDQISTQTGYDFLFKSESLKNLKPVNIQVENAELKDVLDEILKAQNLEYTIENKSVIISRKMPSFLDRVVSAFASIDVHGVVLDEKGDPLVGATVKVKGLSKSTKTNEKGEFYLPGVDEKAVLVISYLGYENREVNAAKDLGKVQLVMADSKLEEVTINAGYYIVKDRERTGSISRITSKDIEKQPVSNLLAAMQANIPGVQVTQNTGVPGGGFKVEIRGRNSISQGNSPFYIIDGVPFTSSTLATSRSISITPDPSPLASINPLDIESIEVLKDADATAIYGSRGANGVVLITTKKGKAGKALISASYMQGLSRVASRLDLMNTEQYLAMRREAFANDKIAPASNQYDVNGTWSENNNTDWQKELIGGIAPINNLQTNLSGGTQQVTYRIGGGYYREGTVFPGQNSFNRGAGNFSLQYTSDDKKFNTQLSANYSQISSNLFSQDLTAFILLPPNYPDLMDERGELNWNTINLNPMASIKRVYDAKTNNLVGNFLLSYTIIPDLQIKTSLGYTTMYRKDYSNQPLTTISPTSASYNSDNRLAYFGNNSIDTWILEPQVDWNKQLDSWKFNLLIGATFQQSITDGQTVKGTGYTSDALLKNIASASALSILERQYLQYRYTAFFGRLNYTLEDKYIINVTARRDGSSRFGTDNRFANFGAIGLAWIISGENFIKDKLPLISFAKLRGSYGVTGNDQISDYGYLELWNTFFSKYQGASVIIPDQISNPNYAWEINKKIEVALDLSLLKDKVNLSAGYYSNKSSNQLIRRQLAPTVGFISITDNLPATVRNTGWEFEINTKNNFGNTFDWSVSINLTIPKNKLISYPGLKTSSSDFLFYEVGSPLSILKTYNTSVDAETGLYTVEDYNNNGAVDNRDRYLVKFIGRKYYGGVLNKFTYKGFEFDFIVQGVKQSGKSSLSGLANTPGSFVINSPFSNQPREVLDHWQKQGDIARFQKFSTGNAAVSSLNNSTKFGDKAIDDSSFIRLKNVSLAYNFPIYLLQKYKVNGLKFYLQGQNLITLTKYKGLDPESQSIANLPSLQVFSAGLQILF